MFGAKNDIFLMANDFKYNMSMCTHFDLTSLSR